MKILVIEDEKIAAKRLCQMIGQLEPEAEIVGTLESVQRGIEWLQQQPQPDLLFMDIHLADGICFEIFERVKTQCPVIFITAYDSFAIQAFKVNSLDYILKPFTKEDLRFALNKYQQHQSTPKEMPSSALDQNALSALAALLKPNYKSRFFIKINHTIHSISNDEVAYFHSSDASTLLTNRIGRHFVIDYTLDDLEKLLDPQQFFRINRQYLIHITAIEKICTYSKGRIQINLQHGPDMALLVSRSRTKGFREWLGQ